MIQYKLAVILISTLCFQSAIGGVTNINNWNEFQNILKAHSKPNDGVVLLLCKTDCNYCPAAEKLLKTNCDKNPALQCVQVIKTDVFSSTDPFITTYNVQDVPYMVFFSGGKQVDGVQGDFEDKMSAGFDKLSKEGKWIL